MKKNVPDPPYELCVGPNLSHNDAIQHAEKHLESALRSVKLLPEQAHLHHQHRLEDAILSLKISKAMLTLSQAKTPMTVPIE